MNNSKYILIEELEDKLDELAYQWRKQHSRNNLIVAQAIVDEYRTTIDELWSLGWDGEGLLPESQLPDELMPEYYLKRWGRL